MKDVSAVPLNEVRAITMIAGLMNSDSLSVLYGSVNDPTGSERRESAIGSASRESGPNGRQDSVELSPEAKAAAAEADGLKPHDAGTVSTKDKKTATDPNADPKVRAAVQELRQIDQEVRAHEAAHVAAAGQYVRGGASFSYRTGPDGKRYAIAGEVGIDASPVPNDPEATMMKMEAVKRAATAPARPSAQDMKVAASAAQSQAQARMELAAQRMQETRPGHSKGAATTLYSKSATVGTGTLVNRHA
jgi:hypothetical protein